MKEKKDPVALEAFFSLTFHLLSLCNMRLSLHLQKGKLDTPRKERGNEHMAEQSQQDSTPFDLFTRDLGTSPSLAHL